MNRQSKISQYKFFIRFHFTVINGIKMYNNNTSHETEMSCFGGGPNFCPECGNVLPLPGIPDVVCCPGCSFRIPVSGKFHIRVYVWAWAAEILLLSHFLFFSFRFHLDIPVIFIQPVQMKWQSSYLRAICCPSLDHFSFLQQVIVFL